MSRLVFIFSIIIVLVLLVKSFTLSDVPQEPINDQVKLGTPYFFNEDTSVTQSIIERPEYVLSYDPDKGCANWVAWQLTDEWIGSTPRKKGRFLQDTQLEKHYRISHNDYTHSGYDRGHLVRSKERTNSESSNRATFFMTNVIPQTPDLNRGVWLNFEYHCQELAEQGHELYITAGGTFNDTVTLSSKGKVVIPDSCFKAVTVIKPDKSDTSFLAVMMPNSKGIRGDDWEKYQTSIKHIERSTGLDLFSEID